MNDNLQDAIKKIKSKKDLSKESEIIEKAIQDYDNNINRLKKTIEGVNQQLMMKIRESKSYKESLEEITQMKGMIGKDLFEVHKSCIFCENYDLETGDCKAGKSLIDLTACPDHLTVSKSHLSPDYLYIMKLANCLPNLYTSKEEAKKRYKELTGKDYIDTELDDI